MEILFLVLWRMRQEIDFHKNRAVLQGLMSQQGADPKSIEKAFEDLRQSFFPFEKTQREEEVVVLRKVLDREMKRGALSVRPMVDMTQKKMSKKLAKGQESLQRRANMLRVGQLQKLDNSPLADARQKPRRSKTASSTK